MTGGIDNERMVSRASMYASEETPTERKWVMEGLKPHESSSVAQELRRRADEGDEVASEMMNLCLFGDGRNPSGFAALVKLHANRVPQFQGLHATARSIRRGSSQEGSSWSVRNAPLGLQSLVQQTAGPTGLGHTTLGNAGRYDPTGRNHSILNATAMHGEDEGVTTMIGQAVFRSSQLLHRLSETPRKMTFDEALALKEKGGRGSDLYQENLWLVRTLLKEAYDRVLCTVVDSDKRTMSAKMCFKRVINKWFLQNYDVAEEDLAQVSRER